MRVNTFSHFSDLPMIYERLFEQVEKKSVFFAKAWFERTCEHFVPHPDSLRLYGIEKDDQAIGLLVATESLKSESRLALPKLIILQGCTTTQSFRSALLIHPEIKNSEDVISSLFAAIKTTINEVITDRPVLKVKYLNTFKNEY